MKMRMIGLLTVASLILAFAFIAVAPAAPNKANAPATNAANALPATPAAAPAERHPESAKLSGRYAGPRGTWSTPRMTSAVIVSKLSAPRMKRSGNSISA